MAYFAYISKQCDNDALKHGKRNELKKLCEKIEADQSIASWDKFLPSPYVKKSLGNSFRLLAEQKLVDDDIVVFFLALMPRGGAKYEKFFHDLTGLPPALDQQSLKKWIEGRADAGISILPSPSDVELGYLYRAHSEVQDELIYETADWVERIEKLQNVLPFIVDLLNKEVLVKGSQDQTIARNENARILFRRFPDQDKVLLIAPLLSSTFADEPNLRAKYESILQTGEVADSELRRHSRRAFPALLAADIELWTAVQKDSAANLALSPEEMDVLASVLTPAPNGPLYPLFINGRPGSGKSTILQYLFAEQLRFHLALPKEDRATGSPLYLTYSERLHALAKNNVKRLLQYNAEMMLRGPIRDLSKTPEFDSAFALFQDFVRSLLPASTAHGYLPSNRIGFARFRREWVARARTERGSKALTADLAWHVIRTFIKGMRDDNGDYFDTDSYRELPAKRRTVTIDTYRRVFDDVWGGWYGSLCNDNNLWDDQDLTREALDARPSSGTHPAIFCDEAQDFTRIELELILRLSLFASRSVAQQDLRRIPFAFAGDPFQTLNPTGFQWSSVGAGFHEQVVQELDPNGKATLQFNQRELSFNYRSSRHIVGFCNSLQMLRAVLFDIGGLKPQQTWSDRDSILPEVFRVDDPDVLKELRAQEELVVILPCQEGAESDYIENDEHLKTLKDTAGSRNFLSSLSAKGLEFSRVVLYKFGEECRTEYARLLEPLISGCPHSDPEGSLPLEYFLNRLYVAASRPKNRLFIVDTQAGIDYLWQSPDLRDLQGMIKRQPKAADLGWSVSALAWTQPGAGKIGSDDADSPLALAEQFFEQGVAGADAYLLELAEANYRRADKPHRAAACKAIRLELVGNFEEAGSTYQSNGQSDDAFRCFWRAGKYEIVARMPETKDRLEGKAARFASGSKTSNDLIGFMNLLKEEINGPRREILATDAGLASVVDSMVSGIASRAKELPTIKEIFEGLRTLQAAGLRIKNQPAIATIALAAGDARHALAILDLVEKPNSDEYRRAKADGRPYPSNVRSLAELNRFADIVASAKGSPKLLGEEDAKDVLNAFIRESDWSGALQFAERQATAVSLLETLVGNCEGLDAGTRLAFAYSLLRHYAQQDRWKEATKLVQAFRSDDMPGRALRRFLILSAASAETLTPKARRDDREALYLFLQTDALFRNDWDPELFRPIGAIIERAGKILDSLSFYEEAWQSRTRLLGHRTDFEYAEQRWCKCKNRQADHSEMAKRKEQARLQRAEADSRALHLGVRVIDLPEYPPVSWQTGSVPDEAMTTDADQRVLIRLAASQGGLSPAAVAKAMSLPIDVVVSVLSEEPLGPFAE